jgi:hypothetical protein
MLRSVRASQNFRSQRDSLPNNPGVLRVRPIYRVTLRLALEQSLAENNRSPLHAARPVRKITPERNWKNVRGLGHPPPH